MPFLPLPPPPKKSPIPKTVWDALSAQQKVALTPFAKEILSQTGIEFDKDFSESGMYYPKSNMVKIWSGLNDKDTSETIMHEAMHVMDGVTGKPSSYIERDNIPFSTRQKIWSDYTWKKPLTVVPGTEADAGKSSFILSNGEIFATAGEKTRADIPVGLKDYYSMIYAPPPPVFTKFIKRK